MTLSIKNTAGALYKSQIKGENRYCMWLRNSNVFRRRRKQSSDGAALTSAGRLFHARDAATGKVRWYEWGLKIKIGGCLSPQMPLGRQVFAWSPSTYKYLPAHQSSVFYLN